MTKNLAILILVVWCLIPAGVAQQKSAGPNASLQNLADEFWQQGPAINHSPRTFQE
jgi:hypothetical protein